MDAPPPYHDVTADQSTAPITSEKTLSDVKSRTSRPIKTWHISTQSEDETKTVTDESGKVIYTFHKIEKKLFPKHRHPEFAMLDTSQHVLGSVKLNAKTEQHAMLIQENPASQSRHSPQQEVLVSWQGDAFRFILDKRYLQWKMELTESLGTYSLHDENSDVVLARYENLGEGARLMFLDEGLGEKAEVAGLMGVVAVEEGMKIAREENADGRHGGKFAGGSAGGMEGSVGAGFGGGGLI